jgi:hypothetical protein
MFEQVLRAWDEIGEKGLSGIEIVMRGEDQSEHRSAVGAHL